SSSSRTRKTKAPPVQGERRGFVVRTAYQGGRAARVCDKDDQSRSVARDKSGTRRNSAVLALGERNAGNANAGRQKLGLFSQYVKEGAALCAMQLPAVDPVMLRRGT